MISHLFHISLISILLALTMQQAVADQTGTSLWRLCPNTGLLPKLSAPSELPKNGEIIVQADTIESQGNQITTLSGNVEIHNSLEQIQADKVKYDPTQQQFQLSDNVHFRSEHLQINASSMTKYTNNDTSELHDADFFIPDAHASGSANLITRKEANTSYLYNATFSTCPPENRDWYFASSKMKLDHTAGFGIAKHMTLRLKGVPIFYFPVVSFPINDRRKSGFLYPTIGNSDRHGFEMEIPWYWNIAPQADAVLTTHHMDKRGTKLNTEWHYLNSWSKNNINIDYLDDELLGDTRSLLEIDHSGSFGRNWSTLIRGAEVSDIDYYQDFGNTLSVTSSSHISQTATLTGQWQHWKLVNKLQSFQTIDDAILEKSRPYRQLPDIELAGLYSNLSGGLELELNSSYTIFDRKDRIKSKRFDIWPHLSRPFGGSSWFVIPAISSRYTSYKLQFPSISTQGSITNNSNTRDELTRSIPTTSLDSGLIFERTLGDKANYSQTFEPRLFYLKVPYRNQDDIPIFDTNLPDFGFFQLYEENRFAGTDRMGDTKQVSLELSSRLLKRQSGEELLKFSLGQIHYKQDREVTLPRGKPETTDKSGVIATLDTRFSQNWSTSINTEWNPETGKNDKKLFRLRYNQQNRYILNLGYRFRRDTKSIPTKNIEQSDISFILPIGSKWSAIGRWNYSIKDELDLEKFIGIEYESCCWTFRLLSRKFLIDDTDSKIALSKNSQLPITADTGPEFEQGIYFEISFKGLASAGNGVGRRLEESIIGYRDPFE